jgi:hypothetical protein
MQSSDLAFHTCEELIAELMRRKTFYGCVIHSIEDHKHDRWKERTFRVHFNNNVDRSGVGRLLDRVAEYINVHLE